MNLLDVTLVTFLPNIYLPESDKIEKLNVLLTSLVCVLNLHYPLAQHLFFMHDQKIMLVKISRLFYLTAEY
jgi:hypothetical protein